MGERGTSGLLPATLLSLLLSSLMFGVGNSHLHKQERIILCCQILHHIHIVLISHECLSIVALVCLHQGAGMVTILELLALSLLIYTFPLFSGPLCCRTSRSLDFVDCIRVQRLDQMWICDDLNARSSLKLWC